MTSPDDLDASHAQSGAVPELVPKCLHGAYAVAQRHLPFLDPDYTPPTSWIKTHKAVAALGVIYTLLSGAARAVTAICQYALAPVTLAVMLSASLSFGIWIYASSYMAWRVTQRSRVASTVMAFASDTVAKAIIVTSSCGLVLLAFLELVGQNTIAVATATAGMDFLMLLTLPALASAVNDWDGL